MNETKPEQNGETRHHKENEKPFGNPGNDSSLEILGVEPSEDDDPRPDPRFPWA